jgi:hypothetical protein
MKIGYAEAQVRGRSGVIVPERLPERVARTLIVACLHLLRAVLEEPGIGILLGGLGMGGRYDHHDPKRCRYRYAKLFSVRHMHHVKFQSTNPKSQMEHLQYERVT